MSIYTATNVDFVYFFYIFQLNLYSWFLYNNNTFSNSYKNQKYNPFERFPLLSIVILRDSHPGDKICLGLILFPRLTLWKLNYQPKGQIGRICGYFRGLFRG